MKSGKCPKCQSTDVRVGPPGAGARGPMNKFAVSFWKNIVPERHICMSCGYMEQYVAEDVAREMLAKDPALDAAFAKRIADDAEFAKSPTARLDFFYQRHSSWDDHFNLYPVFRVNQPPR